MPLSRIEVDLDPYGNKAPLLIKFPLKKLDLVFDLGDVLPLLIKKTSGGLIAAGAHHVLTWVAVTATAVPVRQTSSWTDCSGATKAPLAFTRVVADRAIHSFLLGRVLEGI